ncbi:MAG: hypothetical protein ACHQC9_04325 [Alphaproteobacteria bacterium]
MPDEPEDTEYSSRRFPRRLEREIAELRAQDAAFAAVEWMGYSEAVHFALPVFFRQEYVGRPSEQEHVVLKMGETHADWRQYFHKQREREEQIARVVRWLELYQLVEERHGERWVQTARLKKALADEGGPDPCGASLPKQTLPQAVRKYITETYRDGIPAGKSDKVIAKEYKSHAGTNVSERTVRRARTGKA